MLHRKERTASRLPMLAITMELVTYLEAASMSTQEDLGALRRWRIRYEAMGYYDDGLAGRTAAY